MSVYFYNSGKPLPVSKSHAKYLFILTTQESLSPEANHMPNICSFLQIKKASPRKQTMDGRLQAFGRN
jgi:hypothetical protein